MNLFYCVAFRFVTGQGLYSMLDADPESSGQHDDFYRFE